MTSLDTYWHDSMPNIGGWVNQRWLEYLRVCDDLQRDLGITGEVAEIGVFHGKLLIALAHMLAPGGKATALDVFDDQARNLDFAGEGDLGKLKQNIVLYGPEGIDWAFIKADSSAINVADKVRLTTERGPFRLFSVDGCHTLEHTLNDLITAADCLAPGGVIILDDTFQPHWPGVTEAVALFCRQFPRVRPFLYCAHKLFFIGHGFHGHFLRACNERFANTEGFKPTLMFGSEVASVFP